MYLVAHQSLLFILLAGMYFVLVISPGYFYDNKRRTRRWAKKHYPHIYKLIYRFKEKEKKDRMVVGPCLLKVEGQGYFLGPYARQLPGEKLATITGFVLLTEKGELADDEGLFAKALLTHNYSIIGAVSGQDIASAERQALRESSRIYAPRSEKVLKILKNYFDQCGYLYEWQTLLEYLPDLFAAAKDAFTIYDGREKFRKAMGYSFGYEFRYDDAVQEMEMRQAFSKYMLAAHFKTINNVRVLTANLRDNLKNNGGMVQRLVAMNALKTIWNLAFMLSNLIDKMAVEGNSSEDVKRLFREKTAYAKQLLNASNS